MRPVGRVGGPTKADLPVLLHLTVAAFFALLTFLFTRPLASHFSTAILGAPGDNFSFLWNFWWAKAAVASRQTPFSTPMLFAPLGTSLATHTFVPLMTVGAAYLFPATAPVALYNSAILVAVFLNFVCAYVAAFTMTRNSVASVFAGIAFGGAPFLNIRAGAHLNVLSAWGLPLTIAATVIFTKRPTPLRGVWIALALTLVAYTDYYYFVFGVVMVAAWLVLSEWHVAVIATPVTASRERLIWIFASLLTLVLGAAAVIGVTGGGDTSIGSIPLRMTDTFNARVLAGLLFFALVLVWKGPRLRVRLAGVWRPGEIGRALIPSAVLLVVLISPLVISAFNVWRAGDYTSQTYVWRSAPPGIDVASLLMGSSLNPLTGSWTSDAFRKLGINGVEGAAWPGFVPLVLLVVAWRLRNAAEGLPAATCLWIAALFLVWALGPYLRVFGYNTAVMLPQTFLRYVPIVANARIPGRAFTVVQLMAAMLCAIALAPLPRAARDKTWIGLAAIVGVLVDFVPAARPVTTLETPRVYEALKDMPRGIVLNIPLGMRDGFGARGNPREELLFYQTRHGQPQMGGFVARLSSRIASAYENNSVLRPILDFSEGREPQALPQGPCHDSLACEARYIVIDERAASPPLQQFVLARFPEARLVLRDGDVALFSIVPGDGRAASAREVIMTR